MDFLFSLWHSSCDVVCFMIYWSVSMTYVNLIMRICRMDVNMSGFYLWSGMMSFCIWMICSVVYVVFHSRIDAYNSCMWLLWWWQLSLCHDLEQPLYESCQLELQHLWKCDCDLEWLCLSLSSWQCLELDLAWWLLCGMDW